MTKAERIFTNTYSECYYIVSKYGYDEKTRQRMSSLITRDGEEVCRRTFNAIRKLIESERNAINLRENMGIFSHEEAEQERQAVKMIENTLDHEIEIQKEIDLCDLICD